MTSARTLSLTSFLLLTMLSGCTEPGVDGRAYGCPGSMPEAWSPDLARDQVIDDLLAIIVCKEGPSGVLLRMRHVGHPDLWALPDDLREYLRDAPVEVEVQWFDRYDTQLPGQAPIPPLRFEDLEGVRIPVIRFSTPSDGGDAYLFTTSVEAPTHAEPWNGPGAGPTAAADLSASAFASALAALLEAGDLPYRVDLIAYTGELGYNGWTGISYYPHERENRDLYAGYRAAVNVQNVGHCGFESHPSILESNRDSNVAMREHLKPIAASHGIAMEMDARTPWSTSNGEWGVYSNPAKVIVELGIPALSIDGGWWSRAGPEGGLQDDLDALCREKIRDFSSFLEDVMDEMTGIPQDPPPACEREYRPCR